MTSTLPPLAPSELSDLKSDISSADDCWQCETILRLIDMVERRDAVLVAAQAVVDDVLLSGAIESSVGRLPTYPVPPSSTTAKLIRLREALSTTEPQK